MKFIYAKNDADMVKKAGEIIVAQVLLKENSVLGLATGSTPIGVYAHMIKKYEEGVVSFKHVTTVNLDEYCGLPATSKDSYRYYMDSNLFNHIDIDPDNTYLPNGMANDVLEECERYTKLVDSLGGVDLQLLGIGMNGHIGFNEPADSFVMDTNRVTLSENTREVNAVYFKGGMDEMPTSALTMGMRQIMQAKLIVLVAGSNKNEILEAALTGPVTPRVPASVLQMHGNLIVVRQ